MYLFWLWVLALSLGGFGVGSLIRFTLLGMLKLICIDVDGTLVGSSGDVLPQIWQKIQQSRELGQHLTICSGRPGFGKTLGWAKQLEPAGWHIFQSGASILCPATGETLSSPLPVGALEQLVLQSEEQGWILEVYSDFDWVVNSKDDRAVRHADLLGVPLEFRDFSSLRGTAVRAQWVVPTTQAEDVLARKLAGLDYHSASSPVMPDTTFISITKAGVSKGSAIATVAFKWQVPLSKVMMVGDAPNDLEAFAVVGHPVAMGNADPLTKSKAKHQVGHVDQLGLLEALELSLRLE
jgi:Cof subfamily protein (haloacid dehalogenase superfamily)